MFQKLVETQVSDHLVNREQTEMQCQVKHTSKYQDAQNQPNDDQLVSLGTYAPHPLTILLGGRATTWQWRIQHVANSPGNS